MGSSKVLKYLLFVMNFNGFIKFKLANSLILRIILIEQMFDSTSSKPFLRYTIHQNSSSLCAIQSLRIADRRKWRTNVCI